MTATEDTIPESAQDRLAEAWGTKPGVVNWLSNVNHKAIGFRFIVTAFVFLLVGGIQAAMMRTQLIGPEREFLGPDAYNQTFTLHGTTMMFLFAVPMLEGLAMYFVPLMIGARDLPFPRLNAFGYWLFLFAGVFLYSSLLTGSVPDGGWFNYPPLTGPEFRPGSGIDFWLLGVTMTELSGIVGALELVVCIARQRAPGMSLNRIPVFVWGVLVTSVMILFAFPPLVTGSLLLELDRKIGTQFYNPAAGGDPILWQHLFWIFGHPEVYIMLIPAVGILATMLPAFTRRGIVAYPLVVVSLVAIGFISFGLWVHHMFAAGLPALAMAFFTAASMAIAIPSGVQVFSLIATLWRGKLVWSTPLLYIVGFVLVFVLGGITGVMVASVSFDGQVHDTFFVVAHFHYVLIGGVVLPILGGLHYWFPKLTGRLLDERLGKTAFWLIFTGMNVTFFPQHILGFLGMPRRVYTFHSGLGWDFYNLVSSLGAFVMVAGFAVYTLNVIVNWSRGQPAGDNPWDAPTLEWATSSPAPAYNFAAVPVVNSLYPLWEPDGAEPWGRPGLLDDADGQRRETVSTTILDAEAAEVMELPGNTPWPLVAALAIVVLLFAVLVDSAVLGVVGAAATVGSLLGWLWTGPEPSAGPGQPRRRAPVRLGLLIGLAAVATMLVSLVFSYFLLMFNASQWPPEGIAPPGLVAPAVGLAFLVTSAAPVLLAGRAVGAGRRRDLRRWLAVAGALGVAVLGLQAAGYARLGFAHDTHAYTSLVVTLSVFHTAGLVTALVLNLVTQARAWLGHFSAEYHEGVRLAALWWYWAVVSGIVVFATLFLGPSLDVEPGP